MDNSSKKISMHVHASSSLVGIPSTVETPLYKQSLTNH